METDIIKIEDFLNWIIAQPDDRPVDMRENASHNACGCVMVQFGKAHNFFNNEEFNCGFTCWGQVHKPKKGNCKTYVFENAMPKYNRFCDYGISSIFSKGKWNEVTTSKTFGELKKFI